METDPCSYYQRKDECGSYPTCKKSNNAGPRTCANYVCPPTKICKMDGGTPKCLDDNSKVDRVGYDTSELKNPNDQPGGGSLYPNLRNGETTPRPNIGYQGGGQGYQGGQIGSGYPGQPRPNYPQQNYPQQPYPRQGGYPGYNGYNQQGGYQGYPQQGGYPNNYYNNQRYPNNYQGGYNPYGQQNRNPQNNGSGGIVDSLTNALKKYGLFYMIVACYYHRIWDF
ncbi:SSXT [Asbolus verrucosus]|uniref:SSXT n=1 Tax=Asbolus verrucosus TaxID=1661398 RepID=A0A482VAH0_ASBVE|nr:SSXT [Asbolus verrucosus]